MHYFHAINDVDDTDIGLANQFGDIWMKHEASLSEDDIDEDFSIPKLKWQASWISFHDSMIRKLKSTQTGTEFSLHYLISETPHRALRANANYHELDNFLDLELEENFDEHRSL